MEENEQTQQTVANTQSQKLPTHTGGLVLGILSIVFALLFALVGDVLSIIGIVVNVMKRKEYNTTAGLVMSIIGLCLAIANNILGAIIGAAIYSNL